MRANFFWNLKSAAYASPFFARVAGSYTGPGRGVVRVDSCVKTLSGPDKRARPAIRTICPTCTRFSLSYRPVHTGGARICPPIFF